MRNKKKVEGINGCSLVMINPVLSVSKCTLAHRIKTRMVTFQVSQKQSITTNARDR